MRIGMVSLLLAAVLQTEPPAGDADTGKKAWQTRPGGAGPNQAAGTLWCSNCHGANAEGGFGPDLAVSFH